MKKLLGLFAILSLLPACGLFGDPAGTRLNCEESGWLEEAKKTWNGSATRVAASATTAGARAVEAGKKLTVSLTKKTEDAEKNLNVDLSVVEEFGHQGEYGGYLAFTPKESGLYRVSGTNFWQSISLDGKGVLATQYVSECLPMYKIVEWELEKGKRYNFQFFRAPTETADIVIYKAPAKK